MKKVLISVLALLGSISSFAKTTYNVNLPRVLEDSHDLPVCGGYAQLFYKNSNVVYKSYSFNNINNSSFSINLTPSEEDKTDVLVVNLECSDKAMNENFSLGVIRDGEVTSKVLLPKRTHHVATITGPVPAVALFGIASHSRMEVKNFEN